MAEINRSSASNTPGNEKHLFQWNRLKVAVIYGGVVSTVVLILFFLLLLLTSRLPGNYRMYFTFGEWTIVDTTLASVGTVGEEIILSLSRIDTAFAGIWGSTTAPDPATAIPPGNTAGIARLLSIISVPVVVAVSYRKQLKTRYRVYGETAQYDDFEKLQQRKIQYNSARILYVIATGFGTYVVTSVLWLALSLAFQNLTFTLFWAWVVIILFTFSATIVSAFWALAVTTREIFLIGMMMTVAGLLVSFSIAPQIPDPDRIYWWQHAVSMLGKYMPSAPLFTATLTSMACTLLVVWFDIENIVARARSAKIVLIRGLYFYAVLGFLLIGFVRVGDPIANFIPNFLAHSVFGALFAFAALFWVCWVLTRNIDETIFSPWYKRYIKFAAIASIVVGVVSFIQLEPFGFGDPNNTQGGKDIINLTTAELVIFALTGILLWITVELLLLQAEIATYSGLTTSEQINADL
jgi:hypothetical protein